MAAIFALVWEEQEILTLHRPDELVCGDAQAVIVLSYVRTKPNQTQNNAPKREGTG